MNSFSVEGDELRTAQEAFRSHFQAGISSQTPDTNDRDEGAQPSFPRKRRRAITDAERKALQDHYFNHEDGKPAQKAVCARFLQEF